MPRKSPKESATRFKVGTKKRGLDGNMWIIKTVSNGTKRWVKAVKSKGKTYYTHMNGARPFKVVIDKLNVKVYEAVYGPSPDWESSYDKLTKSYTVKKVRVGRNVDDPRFGRGNSIILHWKKDTYVFICGSLIEFKVPKGEVIQHFVSPIGRNDVPYPTAKSQNYAYFLSDMAAVPLYEMSPHTDWNDAYGHFFGHSKDDWYDDNWKGFMKKNTKLKHKVIAKGF